MQMDKTLKLALASMIFNAVFAIYHLVLGIVTGSWWLLTLGSYYLILSIVRLVILYYSSNSNFITKFTGWMLILLSAPLVGTVVLSIVRDRGQDLHMVLMIAMAAYTFTKITIATIKLIKSRHINSGMLKALRNISFAEAFVSIFALQRSMLVSFEGMNEVEIIIMNASLGTAVCVVVFMLGIALIRKAKLENSTIEKTAE